MMIKLLTYILLLLSFVASGQKNQVFFEKADAFLKSYVKDGKVDYERVSKNGKSDLDVLVSFIAENSYDKQIEKAYLINVYNLKVIDELVKAYPVSSPMNVPGFFDNKVIDLNGDEISLNTLENEKLRKEYQDPRLHFVLVCGALSCPPITNFAYTPSELDVQMENQTNLSLNNDGFVYQDNDVQTVYLSEIFDWYREDFGGNNKALLKYINSYRNEPFNEAYKTNFYTYDWTINGGGSQVLKQEVSSTETLVTLGEEENLQTFTAGSLLHKGQYEFQLFNTMYTQTKSNWLGEDFSGQRETHMSHLMQVTYGISKNKRINIGFDVTFKSTAKSSSDEFSKVGDAFAYTNTDSTRVGITSIGARVRFQPFKNAPEFTMQSTLSGPVIKNAEGNSDLFWADWERLTWWNQFFYTKNFDKFQLFAELDLLYRFKIYENQVTSMDIPLSAFFSYFPTNKITFYVMGQHVPRMVYDTAPQESEDWLVAANYTTAGLGFKYQVSRGLNFELLYTNFWRGVNSGLGSTFNLGIRYITK